MNRLLTTILAAGTLFGNSVYGKNLEEETPTLAQSLAKQLVAKQRPKVSALDFTNIQGMPNELGRFLAEQLAVDLVSADGITVLDRANLSAVMAEHQLTAEGLVKPENAKKLGQFAGVDALLIGNVAVMDKSFTLTVKAISTETAEVIAAGRCKFDVTEDLMKQFSTSISVGISANTSGASTVTGSGATSGNGLPSIQDATAIATKKFDNLEIVLLSVTPSSTQIGEGRYAIRVPAINCAFELHNRDLRNTTIVATNGINIKNVEKISLEKYRSEIIDSNEIPWIITKDCLKGISAVMCFDGNGNFFKQVEQNNPADVATYIRKGTRVEYGSCAGQKAIIQSGYNKYWTGSFTRIAPGKSLRVTAECIPNVGDNERVATKIPQSFQFNMELVIGSIADGADPETAKDLRLENLSFDKIVMPKASKENNP